MNHTTLPSPTRRPSARLHLTKETLRQLSGTSKEEPHKHPSNVTRCGEGTANCAGTNLNCDVSPARPGAPADPEEDTPPPPRKP